MFVIRKRFNTKSFMLNPPRTPRMIHRFASTLLIGFIIFSFSGVAQSLTDKETDSLFTLIKQKTIALDTIGAQLVFDALSSELSDDVYGVKLDYYQAKIHIAKQNDAIALELLLERYSNIKANAPSVYQAKYAELIGRVFGRSENYTRALRYFKRGLVHGQNSNDSLVISSSYLNVGSIFQMKEQMDSATYYYEKVMEYHPKKINDSKTLATVYNNLIGIAISNMDLKLAESYAVKSLKLHEDKKDTLKIGGVLSNLGSINMYTEDYESAKKNYLDAFELLKEKRDLKSREIIALILDNLSQVNYLQRDYQEGYDNLFKSISFKTQLFYEKLDNKIIEISASYELVEKENEKSIEVAKRKNLETWVFFLGLTFCGLILFVFAVFKTNKLKKEKLKLEFEKEKMEQAREIETEQIEVQMKILNATLDSKEAEKRTIAETLQDNVSNLLSSANMHLFAMKAGSKGTVSVDLSKIELILGHATDEIRNLSQQLTSSVLPRFGLKGSVEDLCEKYSNSWIVFKFKSENINRYNESFEIKIHNVIVELINNIKEHSNAYNASVEVKQVKDRLFIKVLDDGDGFNLDILDDSESLGLSQVKARVDVMKGKFEIKSYENTGTQVYIHIPIPK